MATSLTPEQLMRLQQLFSTPVESSDPNANAYMPENVYMDGRTYDRRDSGYMGYDYNPTDFDDPRTKYQSLFNGQSYDEYGKDGSATNTGTFTGIEDKSKYGDMIASLSIMALPFLLPALGVGAAGAAGAAGTAGATGAAGAYGAASSAGMLAPAGLGAASSGTGLWGAGAAGLGGAAGAAGAAGAYGAGSSAGMQGLAGSNAAFNGAMAGGSGLAGVGGAAGGAAGAGGLLSSLGSGSNLLGIGSTLLGAAAGAKGQEQSSSTTRDIPEWLKPYITGNNGLLSQTQQQLTSSRSPERMAQWDQIRNTGLGLMNAPIAGNPTTGWTFGR